MKREARWCASPATRPSAVSYTHLDVYKRQLYLRAEGISADELAKRVAEGASRADVAVGGPADNLVMTIDLADRTGQDLAAVSYTHLAQGCPVLHRRGRACAGQCAQGGSVYRRGGPRYRQPA